MLDCNTTLMLPLRAQTACFSPPPMSFMISFRFLLRVLKSCPIASFYFGRWLYFTASGSFRCRRRRRAHEFLAAHYAAMYLHFHFFLIAVTLIDCRDSRLPLFRASRRDVSQYGNTMIYFVISAIFASLTYGFTSRHHGAMIYIYYHSH